MPGELASFTGLRALGDLDLELVGVSGVLRRDAEAAGRDLLDAAVPLVAEARGILAALTGVRLAAEAVERDGDRLVGLCGERAVRHGPAREAREDRPGGLYLGERNGLACRHELEQVTRLHRRPPVDEPRELLVQAPAVEAVRSRAVPRDRLAKRVGGHELVHRVDDVAVRLVRLAALSPLHVAGALERHLATPGERGCPLDQLTLELVEADARDRARRADERRRHDLGREADNLEDLGAAVAGDVRDTHLRHHLEDAVLDRVLEPPLCLSGRGAIAADLVRRRQLGERLEGEARTDRLGSVPEQAREVMHLARLVRLDDERRLRPKAGRDETVVNEPGGEQRRHRDPVRSGIRDERASRRPHEPQPRPRRRADHKRPRSPSSGEKARVEADRRDLLECVREQEEALELDAGGHFRARR